MFRVLEDASVHRFFAVNAASQTIYRIGRIDDHPIVFEQFYHLLNQTRLRVFGVDGEKHGPQTFAESINLNDQDPSEPKERG